MARATTQEPEMKEVSFNGLSPEEVSRAQAELGEFTGGGGADLDLTFDPSDMMKFDLLPLEHTYRWRITSVKSGANKSGGGQITLGLISTFPEEFAGVSVNDYLQMHPKSKWRVLSLLESVDMLMDVEIDTPQGPRLVKKFSGDSLSELVGLETAAKIIHNEYNGELRNKINRGYLPADKAGYGEAEVAKTGW